MALFPEDASLWDRVSGLWTGDFDGDGVNDIVGPDALANPPLGFYVTGPPVGSGTAAAAGTTAGAIGSRVATGTKALFTPTGAKVLGLTALGGAGAVAIARPDLAESAANAAGEGVADGLNAILEGLLSGLAGGLNPMDGDVPWGLYIALGLGAWAVLS